MRIYTFYNKKCEYCKKTFTTNYRRKRFCSTECDKKYKKMKRLSYGHISDFKIFERDNFTCIYCGKSSITDGIKLNIDHIHPKSKGGKDILDNLITSCERCNKQKNNSILKSELYDKISEIIKGRNKQLFKR